MTLPNLVILWLPPAGEHRLAVSLGLIEYPDRREYRAVIEGVAADFKGRGVQVRVLKCRCWRVVRALSQLGLTNDTASRSAAYGFINAENAEAD